MSDSDVRKYNREQMELREGLPNLYISMQQALEGDYSSLELQTYNKKQVEYHYIDGHRKRIVVDDIRFFNDRLDKLLKDMQVKYADNKAHSIPYKVNDINFGARVTNAIFEPQEVAQRLMMYIYYFIYEEFDLTDDVHVEVPALSKFKGSSSEHSNNKLLKYIIGSNDSVGDFERALINEMEHEKDTVRFMKDGESHKVNLDDSEIVSFEDIGTRIVDDNDTINIWDVVAQEGAEIDFDEDDRLYYPTKEMAFIQANFNDILTNNQVEKFERLVSAIDSGEVYVDELFHPVTNELIIERVGKILFPGKENYYVQPMTRKLIKSMQNRVDKALIEAGFEDKPQLESSFRELLNHSFEDNKKYQKYEINRLVDDGLVDSGDVEAVKNGKMTVDQIITKYGISQKMAQNKNGPVYEYIINSGGELELIDTYYIKSRGSKYIDLTNVKKSIS